MQEERTKLKKGEKPQSVPWNPNPKQNWASQIKSKNRGINRRLETEIDKSETTICFGSI